MRRYMPVFFGGAGLPPDVFARWHKWSREFERIWVTAVTRAMEAQVLGEDDPLVTARLLLGMCLWVSRWYRPADKLDTAKIAKAAIRVLYRSDPAADVTVLQSKPPRRPLPSKTLLS